jgi:sugar phosphate isomerase/epimerase
MVTRRKFIQSTTVASASLFLAPSLKFKSHKDIGLQLYTVRDFMGKDPAGTLKQVAEVGYKAVEGATYTGSQLFYGMGPNDFAKLLKDTGLYMPSAHYRLGEEKENNADVKGTLLHEWQKAVDDAAAIGVKYMVCAYLSLPERGDIDHYKYLADTFNKSAEICKKAGIQFCYHNHDFEFDKQGDIYPYDILLNNTDKDLVKMEVDLYWVTKAGQDPIALFNKHPKRFPLWHVKDMDNTPQKMFTEVGNGVIDFKKIFAEAKTAGMKHFFVEQDKCPGNPFDSIKKSYSYISTNLV